MHDVEHHIDQLWAIGSEIAGKDYTLNAAEGFVLGGAFLLHDAGLSLAAFPNRLEGLQKTDQFKDSLVLAFRLLKGIEMPHAADLVSPPPEVFQQAVFDTLRVLHSDTAAKLLLLNSLNQMVQKYFCWMIQFCVTLTAI